MSVGLVSLFTFVIPGLSIIWLTTLAYGLLTGFTLFNIICFVIISLLMIFGNMVDQNELAPEKVVSSAVWNLTPTVEYLVSQIASGSYTAQDLKDFSMFAKGGASLAPFHNIESKLPAALVAAVKAKEDAIKAGLFRVDISEGQPAAVN